MADDLAYITRRRATIMCLVTLRTSTMLTRGSGLGPSGPAWTRSVLHGQCEVNYVSYSLFCACKIGAMNHVSGMKINDVQNLKSGC